MHEQTKAELLLQLRRQYRRAGRAFKRQLLTQAVQLLDYHRKAAIHALRHTLKLLAAPVLILGRPREYHPATLLPVLKPIWFAAFQPCGSRLVALLPEWLPAYETDHRRLDADVRAALLAISARTLDRLLAPLRVSRCRRGGTRPGNLLRQRIPSGMNGPRKVRAGWSWTRWLSAVAPSMTGTCGCSTRWTSTPTWMQLRVYGPAQTPLARVLSVPQVAKKK